MKLFKYLAVSAAVSLAACQKEESSNNISSSPINSFSEIIAPANFNFETSKQLTLNISVENNGYSQASVIEVFDSNPQAEGELIYKGFTSNDNLSTKINVPSIVKRLYVLKTDPTGSQSMEVIEVNSSTINYAFKKKASTSKKTIVVSPDCTSGCTYTVNNNSSWNSLSSSGTYCFTGNIGGSIAAQANGIIIRLCGTGTISQLSLNNDAVLHITDGSNITIKNFYMYSSSNEAIVYENATLTIEKDFGMNGSFTNHGTLVAEKNFSIYSGSGNEFINNGSATLDKDFKNDAVLINNGTLDIDKKYQLYSGSENTNNCKITVGDDLNMSDDMTINGGYLLVEDLINLYSGNTLELNDGAFVKAEKLTQDGTISGSGTTSLVKVLDKTIMYSTAVVDGSIEFCDEDGIETDQGSFTGVATEACAAYIATSSCIPEGNGVPTVSDDDNDNVANDQDLFPNDPDRAGETYYPGSNSFATIAFEDLWPAMGDYDFNDLVLDYRIRMITDADNKVKDIEFDYKVRATGAGFKNGFGFMLDLDPSKVSSVSRETALSNLISLNANGTEAGQSKTVLIFFDNSQDELPNVGGAFVNTVPGSLYSSPVQRQVKVTFTNGEDASNFNDFNPFLIVDGDRSKEIHLSGFAPTDLATTNLFGTSSDDSKPSEGRYYVNKNNLPWAIEISSSASYPSEKNDIVLAYNYFAAWAFSGGTSNADWHTDVSGYRDASLLY